MYTDRTKAVLLEQNSGGTIEVDSKLLLSLSNALGIYGIQLCVIHARFRTIEGPACARSYSRIFNVNESTSRNHLARLRTLNLVKGDMTVMPHEIESFSTPTAFDELNRCTLHLPIATLNDLQGSTGFLILSIAYIIERVIRKRFPSDNVIYKYPLKSRGYLYPKSGKHLPGVAMSIIASTLSVSPQSVCKYISGLGLKRLSRIPHGQPKPLCRAGRRDEEYTTYRLEDSYSYLGVKVTFHKRKPSPELPDIDLLQLDATANGQSNLLAAGVARKFGYITRLISGKDSDRIYDRMLQRGYRIKNRWYKIDVRTLLPNLIRYYLFAGHSIKSDIQTFISKYISEHKEHIQQSYTLQYLSFKKFEPSLLVEYLR